jgi:hypothetical protein
MIPCSGMVEYQVITNSISISISSREAKEEVFVRQAWLLLLPPAKMVDSQCQ